MSPIQRGWHEPYERDVNGQVIDEVIDWAAMEYTLLRQDKLVATLMVIAAEAVKSGKRSPEYWPVERRWLAGAGNCRAPTRLTRLEARQSRTSPA